MLCKGKAEVSGVLKQHQRGKKELFFNLFIYVHIHVFISEVNTEVWHNLFCHKIEFQIHLNPFVLIEQKTKFHEEKTNYYHHG